MKTVGEWVSRPVPGRSIPRGEIAPPKTVTVGSTAFSAVVRLGEQREVGGRGGVRRRPALNCGSQKRFRFGSLPMMKFWRPGTSRASAAAWLAKLAWSSARQRRRPAAEVVDGDEDVACRRAWPPPSRLCSWISSSAAGRGRPGPRSTSPAPRRARRASSRSSFALASVERARLDVVLGGADDHRRAAGMRGRARPASAVAAAAAVSRPLIVATIA